MSRDKYAEALEDVFADILTTHVASQTDDWVHANALLYDIKAHIEALREGLEEALAIIDADGADPDGSLRPYRDILNQTRLSAP